MRAPGRVIGEYAVSAPSFQRKARRDSDEVGIATALANAVDGPLDLRCTGVHSSERGHWPPLLRAWPLLPLMQTMVLPRAPLP